MITRRIQVECATGDGTSLNVSDALAGTGRLVASIGRAAPVHITYADARDLAGWLIEHAAEDPDRCVRPDCMVIGPHAHNPNTDTGGYPIDDGTMGDCPAYVLNRGQKVQCALPDDGHEVHSYRWHRGDPTAQVHPAGSGGSGGIASGSGVVIAHGGEGGRGGTSVFRSDQI
jgi:hypothetical protein